MSKVTKILGEPEPQPPLTFEQKGDELLYCFHGTPVAYCDTSKLTAEQVQMWKNTVSAAASKLLQNYEQYPHHYKQPRCNTLRVPIVRHRTTGTDVAVANIGKLP